MKKLAASLMILGLSACSHAGKFVEQGALTEEPYVVGFGNSPEAANKSAKAAVPAGYELDLNWNSGFSSCAVRGEYGVWDPVAMKSGPCPSGKYKAEFTLIPTDPAERKEYLELRERRKKKTSTVIGSGRNHEDARKDLIGKLPKNAVVDGYAMGCSVKNVTDPVTGELLCDTSIPNNKYQIHAFVREPNVLEKFGTN